MAQAPKPDSASEAVVGHCAPCYTMPVPHMRLALAAMAPRSLGSRHSPVTNLVGTWNGFFVGLLGAGTVLSHFALFPAVAARCSDQRGGYASCNGEIFRSSLSAGAWDQGFAAPPHSPGCKQKWTCPILANPRMLHQHCGRQPLATRSPRLST